MCHTNPGEALAGTIQSVDPSALEDMGLTELREIYRGLFREEVRSKNLPWLRRQILSRDRLGAPAVAETGLPRPIAKSADALPPESMVVAGSAEGREGSTASRDSRLPEPGTVLSRTHKGVNHEVEVGVEGFRYQGRAYRSLSAIGREVTGHACNGFLFFGLGEGKARHGC